MFETEKGEGICTNIGRQSKLHRPIHADQCYSYSEPDSREFEFSIEHPNNGKKGHNS